MSFKTLNLTITEEICKILFTQEGVANTQLMRIYINLNLINKKSILKKIALQFSQANSKVSNNRFINHKRNQRITLLAKPVQKKVVEKQNYSTINNKVSHHNLQGHRVTQ